MKTDCKRRGLTHILCLIGGAVLGAAGALWGPSLIAHHNASGAQRARDPAAHVLPWGHLDALRIPFANSEDLFADRPVRLQPPRWQFDSRSEAQLGELFKGCGLTELQEAELLDKAHWQSASNGWVVLPSNGLVRSLNPAARQRVYSALRECPANYAQQYPFRFPLDDFEARFDGAGLLPEKLELIEGLTYTNCGTRCLADLEVLPEFLTTNEFQRVIDCLYRFPAYRLRLRVYADSDIPALAEYWGQGGRTERIRPLLESLTKVSATNGASISIGYLLPAFARLRLNTFPSAWSEPQVTREDCFWTSMNFFHEQPDMRFLDPGYVRSALQTEFAPIQGPPAYGDLVTLINDKGDAVHMCVYLAEDYVFTKNGINRLSPWVIMKIPDMLLLFPSEQPHRLVFFRGKV